MLARNIGKFITRSFSTNKEVATQVTVRDAIQSALMEELERDPAVYIIGEEVAKYQGAYKITKGLHDKFGETRIWDTPITEQGFTGLAIGSSMMGLKPVVEFMTWNFALQAIDQIINSCAKTKYMSGGDLGSPIVFRGLNGPAAAVAAQHSQCFAAAYANIPGLKVVSCYDVEDARGLLKSAIRDPNPVIFLENELMYSMNFNVTAEIMDKDFLLPLEKAKIMVPGEHVTIVSYSRMVGLCLEAAAELKEQGVSCEVINLRSIRPLDREAIVNSVKKTNRLVVVEDGYPQHGVGAEICALMMESSGFGYLDAPVQRVTAWDIPMPYAQNLETATLPQVSHIVQAVNNTLYNKKP